LFYLLGNYHVTVLISQSAAIVVRGDAFMYPGIFFPSKRLLIVLTYARNRQNGLTSQAARSRLDGGWRYGDAERVGPRCHGLPSFERGFQRLITLRHRGLLIRHAHLFPPPRLLQWADRMAPLIPPWAGRGGRGGLEA